MANLVYWIILYLSVMSIFTVHIQLKSLLYEHHAFGQKCVSHWHWQMRWWNTKEGDAVWLHFAPIYGHLALSWNRHVAFDLLKFLMIVLTWICVWNEDLSVSLCSSAELVFLLWTCWRWDSFMLVNCFQDAHITMSMYSQVERGVDVF